MKTMSGMRCMRGLVLLAIVAGAVAGGKVAQAQTSYTTTSQLGSWNTSRWNNAADSGPYTSAYTANQDVNFTSTTGTSFQFAGMGAAINVGNVTVSNGVSVSFTANANTFATSGNVRTLTIGTGSQLDFGSQSFTSSSSSGFIKEGAGVLGLIGNTYGGGFTLNAGTVVMRGVNALGGGAGNVLTLNGGVVASSATLAMDSTKYGGGIVIGGNVQFGEQSDNVSIASDTANLSFANDVNLGSGSRTLTLGNSGIQTFSGTISNTSGGLVFAANSGSSGRFDITGTANTFTGNVSITGGEVRFSADGSLGDAGNALTINGGRFAAAGTFTLGGSRSVFVGNAAGTSISVAAPNVLTITAGIADKSGTTGSWVKQGTGSLELGGVSTYTGNTVINAGNVRLITGNDRLPTGTVVSIGQAGSANLGALILNGFNQEVAGLNSITGTNGISGVQNSVTSNTPATLTLSGSGSYAFGDGTTQNSGVITGALSLVKSGTGTQLLGDANTYNGTTTISGGTLALGSSGSIANTPSIMLTNSSAVFDVSAIGSGFHVASGQTLGGIGTVVGDVTMDSGALLAPGLSPGTLTFGGVLDISSADPGSLVFELGSTSDMVDLTTGFLVIGPDLVGFSSFNFASVAGFGPGVYTLFQTTQPILGTLNAGDLTGTIGGLDATLGFANSDSTIVLTVVPEPSALALIAIGTVSLYAWNRKRRPRT